MNKHLRNGMTLVLVLCLSAETQANEFARQWQQPLKLELPQPTRSVLLESMVDPHQWLSTHNIHDAQLLRQGRRTLAQFPMAENDWALREQSLCSDPGVSACDAGACKSIQFRAEAVNADNTEKVKARIIANPPEVEETGELSEDGGMCTTALAPPLAPPDGGVLPADLSLDLSVRRDDNSGAERTANETTESVPRRSMELADLYGSNAPTMRAADFQLQVEPNFNDGAALATDQLPADTSDYHLLVGEGCQALQVPLSSVAPAQVPNLIVALVNGDPAALGVVHRMTPIKQTRLSSTGDTLAVFYSTRPVSLVLPLLQMDQNFLMVEPEHIFTTTASVGASYSDPLAPFTYGPAHTGALSLHDASTGKGETIAVIDTGVALEHPDLQGRVSHEDFTELGWSEDAHGTAVASIIAATANNGLGSYGVAPEANILALKACQPKSPDGLAARCWTSSLVKAMDAAISRDAQIINMSLSGPPDSILAKYVELAVSQKRLVVAGAGNGGAQALPAFPAAIPGVLAVTAVDRNNRGYRDANRGDYIDLAAPGVDIITATPGDAFPASSGTSWAAAHVSGIAALLKPLMPLTAPGDIAFLLRSESVDIGAPGKDRQFGYGVVDACAAAEAATAQAVSCAASSRSDQRAQ